MATMRFRLTLRGNFPRVVPQFVTFRKRNLAQAKSAAITIFAARNAAAMTGREFTTWEVHQVNDQGQLIGAPLARGPRE